MANISRDFHVIARILDVLDHNGPMKRTNVQMLSRINYNTFIKYLDLMARSGMIEVKEHSDGSVLVISNKGKIVHAKLTSLMQDLDVSVVPDNRTNAIIQHST